MASCFESRSIAAVSVSCDHSAPVGSRIKPKFHYADFLRKTSGKVSGEVGVMEFGLYASHLFRPFALYTVVIKAIYGRWAAPLRMTFCGGKSRAVYTCLYQSTNAYANRCWLNIAPISSSSSSIWHQRCWCPCTDHIEMIFHVNRPPKH